MAGSSGMVPGERRVVQVGAVELLVRRWPGEGAPVLLLHGLADHGGIWARVARELAPQFDVAAVDLRGHGGSARPRTGYGTQDYLADLDGLLEALGWGAAHVVAHSWSAKLAASWAGEAPGKVLSLTLVDPFYVGRISPWFRPLFPLLYRMLPFLRLAFPLATLEDARARARTMRQYEAWGEEEQALFDEGVEQQSDGRWASRFAAWALDDFFGDVMSTDALERRLTVPTSLLLPRQGINRFRWQLAPLEAGVEDLRVERVEGHHWFFWTKPEDFLAVFRAARQGSSSMPQPRAAIPPGR